MFNFKSYWDKFVKLRPRKVVRWANEATGAQKKSLFYAPFILGDMAKCFFLYGCSADEYMHFKLWDKNPEQRQSYYFTLHNVNFIETINDSSQLYVLLDKKILLDRLGIHLKREYLDLGTCSENDFIAFSQKHPKFVAKARSLAGGDQITVYSGMENKEAVCSLRCNLLHNNVTLIEEFIQQHPAIDHIYPHSVNTIRIHTLRSRDQVEIVLDPLIRFGSAGGQIDFDGGITVKIDIATGNLHEYGLKNKGFCITHPDTGIPFKDCQIPNFDQIKAFALRLADLVPEINFIGWDIAVSKNGPVAVEGNGAPASYGAYHRYFSAENAEKGIKHIFDALLDYWKKRNNLTPTRIEEINRLLFLFDENQNCDVDIILILGSKYCHYRAERAYRYFSQNSSGTMPFFIASGGGISGAQSISSTEKPVSEAQVICNYLSEKGIANKNIWVEENSKSTKENIRNCKKIIENYAAQFPRHKKINIGVITAGFHMQRTFQIIETFNWEERYKFIPIPAYGAHTGKDNWFKNQQGIEIISNELQKLGHNLFST